LKLTHGHFGARDGKHRDRSASRSDGAAANVEVVDLGETVEGGPSLPSALGGPALQEAIHA